MSNPNRTALLIRCSREEAERVRAAARRQQCTLSSFVMHVLRNRLKIEAELENSLAIATANKGKLKPTN